MDAAVATMGLTVRYGRARGIDEITLAVSSGEVLGLLGPNGAGKTTWLRAVLDLVHPTAGTAEIRGIDSRRRDARIAVSYLPGDLSLPRRLTGWQALRRFTAARGDGIHASARSLAERFGVDLGRRIGALSKGNRQKVGLVIALAPRTSVLLLDEPTSGLDPLVQQEFAAVLRERSARGDAIVLSSHVLSELEHLAQRIAVLRTGRLVAVEEVETLRSRAQSRLWVTLMSEADRESLHARLGELTDVEVARPEAPRTLDIRVRGPMDPVVKALAAVGVERMVSYGGDLEDILLDYYGDGRT